MNELALFAGAGGGILGGGLLGWRTVCAVEWELYPRAYCSPDRMTACSRLSRFGMTFAALTDGPGAELLTWYLAASRARTSAPPARAPESKANAAACGTKWHELSVRYDRASSSWKTHRSLWDEALPWSSVTLPKWGSMRDGVCWERATSALPTGVSGSGLWPTPNVPNGGMAMSQEIALNGGYSADGQKRQIDLANAVKFWPTPTVNDSKNCTLPPSQIKHDNIPGALLRDGEAPGGQLNPTWVEWLMGWPPGWTDLKPSATDRFHSAPPKHGASCLPETETA